jgi:hypothetical protein
VWPLYRFDPRRLVKGEPPLHLDYGPPKARVEDYMRNESRFRQVERADPEKYKHFVAESQAAAIRRYAVYEQLAGITAPVVVDGAVPAAPHDAVKTGAKEQQWTSAPVSEKRSPSADGRRSARRP